MAVIALDFAVSPSKGEFGVLLVVKPCLIPRVWRVAGLTLCAMAASMDVIQPMARNTRAWGMFVALIRVASSAGKLLVFSL